jgi:hypothetical protein
MGQAKQRGTFEERRQKALERERIVVEQRRHLPTRQRKISPALLVGWALGAGHHHHNL